MLCDNVAMVPSPSSSPADRHGGRWFPSWLTVWLVFFLTSAFRVYYVTQPRNWWIMHPDEIYQTMEVAHSEVYGYGLRAYEFNPEPEVDLRTPDIKRQELAHGMWALRSHLLPHLYVTVTWLLAQLGLDFHPFMTWKVFHTVAASTLILTLHRYVLALFPRCPDLALLSAVLVAVCAQLHVLGTHTLVNSLVAPPVFLVLAHLHTLLCPPPDDDQYLPDGSGDVCRREDASSPHAPASAASSSKGGKGKLKGNQPHRNGTAYDDQYLPGGSGDVEDASSPHGPASASSPPRGGGKGKLKGNQPHRNGTAYTRHSKENGCFVNGSSLQKSKIIKVCGSEKNNSSKSNDDNNSTNTTTTTTNNINNTNINHNHHNNNINNTSNNNHDNNNINNTSNNNNNNNSSNNKNSTYTINHTNNTNNDNVRGSHNNVTSRKCHHHDHNGSTSSPNGKNVSVTNGLHPSPNPTGGEEEEEERPPRCPSFSFNKSSALVQRVTQNLVAGLVLGVCVYVRIDVIAVPAACLVTHWRPFHTRYGDVILCAIGAAGGVAVGVWEDFRCYGWGVLTPVNWFRFNVQKDYSSHLFGSHEFHKYVGDIFLQNAGMAMLTMVAVLCSLSRSVSFLKASKQSVDFLWGCEPTGCVRSGQSASVRTAWGRSARPLGAMNAKQSPPDGLRNSPDTQDLIPPSKILRTSCSWLLLLLLYSSKGHKELRFVHNVIVLVLVTWAAVLQSTLAKSSVYPRATLRGVLAVGVVLFALSQWQDVSSLTDSRGRGGNKLGFKAAGDTQDVNECLYFVSRRQDVTGVFIDRNLYATGGYALLHRDVPVFSIFGDNFHEYNVENRMQERTKTWMSRVRPRGGNMSLAYVGRFSNFVSRHNAPDVIKHVMADRRYNYLLVQRHRDSIVRRAGDLQFSCGAFSVYRRSPKPTPQQQVIIERAVSMPPLSNATVLMHEADMLYYHGAWQRAIDRFRLVLSLDPSQVGVYLPLASSHFRQGDDPQLPERVINECYAKFGEEKCLKRRPLLTNVVGF